MFTLTDFRMLFTFAGAVGVAALALLLLRRHLPRSGKVFHPGVIPGSVLFGTGWAITGACPSIVLVQLGQGMLPAAITMAGILMGGILYRHTHMKFFSWDRGVCE